MFPGSLIEADDPQSVTNRAKKTYNEKLIHYRTVQFVLQSSDSVTIIGSSRWYLCAERADRQLLYSFSKT